MKEVNEEEFHKNFILNRFKDEVGIRTSWVSDAY